MSDYEELKRMAEGDGMACMTKIELRAMIAESERLQGLQPDFPPRPPDGEGLPRYGLRWNGPQQPLAVPMDDGYWTPWHLAEVLKADRNELIAAIEVMLLHVKPSKMNAVALNHAYQVISKYKVRP